MPERARILTATWPDISWDLEVCAEDRPAGLSSHEARTLHLWGYADPAKLTLNPHGQPELRAAGLTRGAFATMPFPLPDRELMLLVPGIGPAVIERLEAVGVHSLTELASLGPDKAVSAVCRQLGTTAWANRRKALVVALELAEQRSRARVVVDAPCRGAVEPRVDREFFHTAA